MLPNILEKIDRNRVVFVSDPPFNVGYHYNTYKDKLNEEERKAAVILNQSLKIGKEMIENGQDVEFAKGELEYIKRIQSFPYAYFSYLNRGV